ncbi:pentatricopeptide repeat-containing protein At1g20230-like [Phalaenopsis equestris]|uniref:pentatricopeptide repeat-containing protein At1g20230-like n=1 Tax=Phalaenopsis equestris TaxID=78828 RepID=UPI0009E38FE7|nr:pentatricopeptide repeat-containing protein At1g20230-like [Phalaenopsis equestris]
MRALPKKTIFLKLRSNSSTKSLKGVSFTAIAKRMFFTSMVDSNYSSKISQIIRAINSEVSDDNRCGIHTIAIKSALNLETSVATSLISFDLHLNDLESARSLFYFMPKKDFISWNAIISGLCKCGAFMEAINLFRSMQLCIYDHNLVSFLSVLPACANTGWLRYGRQIHGSTVRRELPLETSLQNSLIDSERYIPCQKSSISVQDKAHSDQRWRIHGVMEGISLRKEMIRPVYRSPSGRLLGLEPDYDTPASPYSRIDTFCSRLAPDRDPVSASASRLPHARSFALLCPLLLCRERTEKAEILFSSLQEKDLFCWSSMINGYGINGHGEKANLCFSRMIDHGWKSNEIVLISLLSACSHSGLLNEWWKWFSSMEEKFGVIPCLAHYACMVDLLGSEGKVESALELVRMMSFESDASIWTALLNWCGTSDGDLKVTEVTTEKLVSIDSR